MKRLAAIRPGFALTLFVLTTACGAPAPAGTSPIASPTEGMCTEDKKGGSLTMGVFTNSPGLDPVSPASEGVFGGIELTALYDTLMGWNPQASRYEPRVAQSLEPDTTYTTWTMKLRPNIAFGNGDPLTASAVKASIERHMSPDNKDRSRQYASLIHDMRVVDPLTLKFTLDDPWPDFAFVLATDVGMITNPGVVKERGAEKFSLDPSGAGVGPYEVARYTPGEEVVLTAKKDYWGGPVCVQELRFISVAGAQGTYESFQNGELDLAFLREPQVVAQTRQDGYADLPTLFGAAEAVVMNSGDGLSGRQRPITSDVRIRRAVAAAIDSAQVNQRVFDGAAIPSGAIVPPQSGPAFKDLRGPGQDPELAKKLVQEVKAEGWDGKIRLLADKSPTHVQESITLKAQLEAVGFTVSLTNNVDVGQLSERVVVKGDYDLAIFGANYAPEGLWARLAPRLASGSPANFYRYGDPRMDAALKALKNATSAGEKHEAVREIQRIWNETVPAAVLASYEETTIVGDNVRGLRLTRGAIIRFENTYVTER